LVEGNGMYQQFETNTLVVVRTTYHTQTIHDYAGACCTVPQLLLGWDDRLQNPGYAQPEGKNDTSIAITSMQAHRVLFCKVVSFTKHTWDECQIETLCIATTDMASLWHRGRMMQHAWEPENPFPDKETVAYLYRIAELIMIEGHVPNWQKDPGASAPCSLHVTVSDSDSIWITSATGRSGSRSLYPRKRSCVTLAFMALEMSIKQRFEEAIRIWKLLRTC
jgi:hypothetical protein